jgi:hypothetical protein
MDIGNKKAQSIGNNYYIETEHKKSYPMRVLLVKYPPILLKSISVATFSIIISQSTWKEVGKLNLGQPFGIQIC